MERIFEVVLVCCAFVIAGGMAAQVVRSPHPFLFFSSEDVPELQRKAKTSHRAIAERIVRAMETAKAYSTVYLPPWNHTQFTSRWNEEYGNDLCTLAMYCVLYPDDKKALELVHEYMERMASQPSWLFSKMPIDEMPISHSLVGMATAYDFLYPTLSPDQRRRYFVRIRLATGRHFERFKVSSWGHVHLHNHVWNNDVALFIGAVVTSVHDKKLGETWLSYVQSHLDISMKFFNLVVDGSITEGVSYSTYTTRSMAMFIHILDRHYNITTYYHSYWLQRYFWFLYRTLIGYKETVGIADANPTWFYGPEAMIVFLDRFVLKNGNGNWLAARIRENRSPNNNVTILSPSKAQRWSTYHLEFIWYDETLGEVPPYASQDPALTLFSDWGVVTYGGGLPTNRTFLSFKSSHFHGRAINAAVTKQAIYQKYIYGWSSFNPGHEHPDQNSFTFWPRGQPFITESYYGPKFSFLNNVLMFAPVSSAHCFAPFEGQLGECYKWLKVGTQPVPRDSPDIVASYKKGDLVFVSGEATGAYGKHLKLKSVYRSLALLSPDVLLVMDHIELLPDSKLKRVNAFFNMRQGHLELKGNSTRKEAILKHSNQNFHVAWVTAGGAWSDASVAGYEYPCEFGTRGTQILNVSVALQQINYPTRVAYLFYHGSSSKPTLPHFLKSSKNGYAVNIFLNGVAYEMKVTTAYSDPQARMDYLGHTGFASLNSSRGERIEFGYSSTSKPTLPTVLVSSMPWSGAELVAGALNKSADFAAITLKKMAYINGGGLLSADDPCMWQSGVEVDLQLPGWLNTLYTKSYSTLANLPVKFPGSVSRGSSARVVILANSSEMDSRLHLLPDNPSTKIVHVLRDPRSWVAYALKSGKLPMNWKTFKSSKEQTCSPDNFSLPYQRLTDLIVRGVNENNLVKVLSLYWVAHSLPVIQLYQNHNDRLLVVWLEDLILEPEATGEKIVEGFLGMPLPPASRHYLLQYTRSGAFKLPSTDEILDSRQAEWWKKVLSPQDLETVEETVKEFVQIV